MWQIIGQGRNVALLQRGLETGFLSHAYLFSGPAHIGKMTLALNLAQALNCPEAEAPCNRCDSCLKIASGKHADVQIVSLGSNGVPTEGRQKIEIGIDQIRELQHVASLPPFEGSVKMFIIDGAEMLSLEAANCLLKTLEEPEEKVIFILLAASEKLLPETVVSRCQVIKLPPVPAGEIETALIRDREVGQEKAKLLARLSHGCPGWAVSAAADDNLLQQRSEWLDGLLEAINGGVEERFSYAAQLAAGFTQNRELVYNRLDLWLDWWRDLLLARAGAIDNVTNIDRLDSLSGMAESCSLAEIRNFSKSIQTAGEQLRQNANPRLALEVLMLDIPETEKPGRVKSAV
jgi:DNA polymerase-3 subunit delta'